MSRLHEALALVAAALGLAAAVGGPTRAEPPSLDTNTRISAPDLADRIIGGDAMLYLFDLRGAEEFAQFHVPGARLKTRAELAREPLPRDATIVLYGTSGAGVADGARVLSARGYTNVRVLHEGVYEWIARVHEPRLAIDSTSAERTEFARAAAQSRFFGGVPRASVPRAEVPTGYWTGTPQTHDLLAAAAGQAVATIRRRGC